MSSVNRPNMMRATWPLVPSMAQDTMWEERFRSLSSVRVSAWWLALAVWGTVESFWELVPSRQPLPLARLPALGDQMPWLTWIFRLRKRTRRKEVGSQGTARPGRSEKNPAMKGSYGFQGRFYGLQG